MKPVRIHISKISYTIDLPVLALFIAVWLDIISTTMFIGLGAGVEKNPILSRLVEVSIWFVPVYFTGDRSHLHTLFVPHPQKNIRYYLHINQYVPGGQ